MDSEINYERLLAELKVLDEEVKLQRSEYELVLYCEWQEDIEFKRMNLKNAELKMDRVKRQLDRLCNVCREPANISFYMGCGCECVPICAPCKRLVDGSACHDGCQIHRTFECAHAHFLRTKTEVKPASLPVHFGGLPPFPASTSGV
jgi:hypothetical protein